MNRRNINNFCCRFCVFFFLCITFSSINAQSLQIFPKFDVTDLTDIQDTLGYAYSLTDQDTVIECVPFSVRFINNTYVVLPNGSVVNFKDAPDDFSFEWVFEGSTSGLTIVDKPNPNITYLDEVGDYDVVLTVSFDDGVNKGSKNLKFRDLIFANKYPAPNYSINIFGNEGCYPLTVKFTDVSDYSNGPSPLFSGGKFRKWSINGVGIQDSLTVDTAVFVFNSPGTYNLNFSIEDVNGCSADKSDSNVVVVKEKANPNFTYTPKNSCSESLTVNLVADETNPAYEYEWTIGNGVITDLKNNGQTSTINIPAEGLFDVELVITNPNEPSCNNSLLKIDSIRVGKPHASISVLDSQKTVCGNENESIQFFNHTVNGEVYVWDFGDGSIITRNDTSVVRHTYARDVTRKTYTVKMYAYSQNMTCSDSAFVSVDVISTQVVIDPSDTLTCLSPFYAKFDASNSILQGLPVIRSWDFGLGMGGQGATNPIVTGVEYTTPNENEDWDITHYVRVKYSNSPERYCYDTGYAHIEILKIEPNLLPNPDNIFSSHDKAVGCAPQSVDFQDATDYMGFTPKDRAWDFGDGSSEINQDDFNSHFFPDFVFEGNLVTLTVETAEGCIAQDSVRIKMGLPPTVDFTVSPVVSCANEFTSFFDQSYVLIDGIKEYPLFKYEWRFSDVTANGNGTQLSTQKNPKVKHNLNASDSITYDAFGNPIGQFPVTLKVTYNGCSTTLDSANVYDKLGPATLIYNDRLKYLCSLDKWVVEAAVQADSNFVYDSGGNLVDAVSHYWYFEGSESDTLSTNKLDTIQLPPNTGYLYFKAVNIVNNCTYTDSVKITQPLYTAILALPQDPCLYDREKDEFYELSTALTVTTSQGVSLSNYRWFVNGVQEGTGINFDYQFTEKGTYIIRCTFDLGEGPFACKNISVTESITVHDPQAEIILQDGYVEGCAPMLLDFISNDDLSDEIISWEWEIRDTVTDALIDSFTGKDPGQREINQDGVFNVQLEVTDQYGCVAQSTITQTLDLLPPLPNFRINKKYYCPGEILQIENITDYKRPITYEWYFNDSLVSTDYDPIIFLDESDTLDIKLVVSDGVNCLREINLLDTIIVEPLPALFEPTFTGQKEVLCPILDAVLQPHIEPLYPGYTYEWQVEGQVFDYNTEPVVSLGYPGLYDLSLSVSTPFANCKVDTIFKDFFNVGGPELEIEFLRDSACLGDSIQFWVVDDKNVSEITWTFSDGAGLGTVTKSGNAIKDTVSYTYERPSGVDGFIVAIKASSEDCNVIYSRKIHIGDTLLPKFSLEYDTICGMRNAVMYDQTEKISDNFHVIWDLGYNNETRVGEDTVRYTYPPGTHVIRYTAIDSAYGCVRTLEDSLWVFPDAVAFASPDSILCIGENYQMSVTGSVGDVEWSPNLDLDDAFIRNPTAAPKNDITYYVTVTDTNLCSATDSVKIQRDSTIADFDLIEFENCGFLNLDVQNNSVGFEQVWSFGDNSPLYTGPFPNHTYTVGEYDITLTVTDLSLRCQQILTKKVFVYPFPNVQISNDTTICYTTPIQLFATGGDFYTWSPPDGLSATDIYNPIANPQADITYTVVVETVNGCIDSASVNIVVHEDFTYNIPYDTTMYIGEIYEFDLDPTADVSIVWNPGQPLICDDCQYFNYKATDDSLICFEVTLVDPFGCYPKESEFCIKVLKRFSLDVPQVFTPNGDGVNDIVYVRGWGIKKLLEFTIFNRWGEIVYSSTDILEGWNGVYKGKLSNDETFVYQVAVEFYGGRIGTKKGYLSILK